MRQAIWAFDFLLLLYPDAELHIAGRGSQLDSLQALVHGLGSAGSVRFLGAAADWADALRDADIVWVPSLADVGRQVALDGMALGKAVIASDVPSLREVIRDNDTGFLVPPGDVMRAGPPHPCRCSPIDRCASASAPPPDPMSRGNFPSPPP